jgi:hypothetical protein
MQKSSAMPGSRLQSRSSRRLGHARAPVARFRFAPAGPVSNSRGDTTPSATEQVSPSVVAMEIELVVWAYHNQATVVRRVSEVRCATAPLMLAVQVTRMPSSRLYVTS